MAVCRPVATARRSPPRPTYPAWRVPTLMPAPSLAHSSTVTASSYREVMSTRQRLGLACLISLNIVFGLGFVVWLLLPSHLPTPSDTVSTVALAQRISRPRLVVAVEAHPSPADLRAVAVRRCLAGTRSRSSPSRAQGSPYSPPSFRRKSRSSWCSAPCAAMKRLEHDGPLDVWILDEGNDPNVRSSRRRDRRQALLPQGCGPLEHRIRCLQGQDEGRQPQCVARRPRKSIRHRRPDGPRPRSSA